MFTGTVERKNNPDCGKYGQSLAEIILVQMQINYYCLLTMVFFVMKNKRLINLESRMR